MANVYGADPALAQQQLTLLTSSRALVRSQVVDITSSAFDHVVRSLADLPTPVAGFINLTTGSWAFAAPINIGANTIAVPIGVEVYLKGMGWDKEITNSGIAISVAGTAVLDSLAIASDSVCVQIESATTILIVDQCYLRTTGSGDIAIRVPTGRIVQVTGGRFLGSGGVSSKAISISGNVTYGVQIANVQVDSLDRFVDITAQVESIVIANCNVTRGNIGVSMNPADTPVQGLTVVGCSLSTATPFSAFTAATARVNLKANLGAAGLLSETPIVP